MNTSSTARCRSLVLLRGSHNAVLSMTDRGKKRIVQFIKQMLWSRRDQLTKEGRVLFTSPKRGEMIGRTNKERGRQASTARYRGVSILQPNPLAFEGQPNILFTWLPSLAGAHTRVISQTHAYTRFIKHSVLCYQFTVGTPHQWIQQNMILSLAHGTKP